MALRGLTKFVHETSSLFHGARELGKTVVKWRNIVTDLKQTSHSLFDNMSRLTLRAGRSGEEIIMIGNIGSKRFAKMMRLGESAAAFEIAAGMRLDASARAAFQQLDRTSLIVMPDWRVIQHGTSNSTARQKLLSSGKIRAGERVYTAGRLLEIVKSDRQLAFRAEKTMSKASRTKKLMYLGGTIAVVGGGIAYLMQEAVLHASRNSGCFMYTTNKGGGAIHKCRIAGCSCPIRSTEDAIVTQQCGESALWDRMKLANTTCSSDASRPPYCVHCDWEEQDENSPNFIDRSKLPDDAYVQCENQDALDALHDIVGGTLGEMLDPIRDVGKGATASLTDSFKIVPVVLSIVGIIVAVIIGVYVYHIAARFGGSIFQGGGGDNERTNASHGTSSSNSSEHDSSSSGYEWSPPQRPRPIRVYR